MPDRPASTGRKERRRKRPERSLRARILRVVGGVLICLMLLMGAAALLTRTALCKVWLLPTIGSAMGVTVEAGHARVLADGTVVLEDAAFILPGIDGEAARFLEVDRLEVDPDLSRPGIPISRMRLDGALLRISQDATADRVNLQFLEIPGSGGGSGRRATAPPRIDLRSGVVQFGEHDAGGFRVLKQMSVRGEIVPSRDPGAVQDAWSIALYQVDPSDPDHAIEDGISVGGTIDQDGVRLTMERASLADWPAAAVPSRHRGVFEMLALEGEIERTFLEFQWEGTVAAGMEVRNVALTLPFERREPRDGGGEAGGESGAGPGAGPGAASDGEGGMVRLTRSGGTILFTGGGVEATLEGWVEDLPYHVELEYQGLSGDSPFTCELTTDEFRLSERPRLLPFMPHEVAERLADFQNPTGIVSAQVLVERGGATPEGEAATTFSGRIRVRDGRAAFKIFPYPFEQMEADVFFDETQVRIDSITGESASGARLVASGLVTPLGEEAEVTIRVVVTGARLDDAMLASMDADQAALLRSIFSRERLGSLTEAGLVLTPGGRDDRMAERDAANRRLAELSAVSGPAAREEAREVRRRLSEAERALRRPEFAFGGEANVNVLVHRERGLVSRWSTRVEIGLPRAGLLPEAFPLPIVARGVRVLIENDELRLTQGTFAPVSGGTAEIEARVTMPSRRSDGSRGQGSIVPHLAIQASDVPLDELLAYAIGHVGGVGAGGTDVPAWTTGLQAAARGGVVSAGVVVGAREDGSLGYDVSAEFDRAVFVAPVSLGGGPRLSLLARHGRVQASESRLDIGFDASLQAHGQTGGGSSEAGTEASNGGQGESAARAVGQARIDASLALRATEEVEANAYTISIAGRDVVSEMPIETLVGVLAPEVETTLRGLRERYEPRGVVGGSVRVAGVLGDEPRSVEVDMASLAGASIALEPGRVGLENAEGVLRVSLPRQDAPGWLAAEAFAADSSLDGVAAGRWSLDGRVELLAGDAGAMRAGALDVRVGVRDADLGSGLVRSAMQTFAPEAAGALLPRNPVGGFDLDLAATRAGVDDDAAYEGVFRPRSFALDLRGQRIAFDSVSGAVFFDAAGGQAEGVRAAGPDFAIAGDASWAWTGQGQTLVEATFSADAAGLSPRVLALLPAELVAGFEEIGLAVAGPVSVLEATISANMPAEGDASVRASGAVHASGVSASVGVPIEEGVGTVWFEADAQAGRPASYTLNIAGDSVRASGVALTRARARVASGASAGEVVIPLLEAEAYGGRLAGSGRMVRGGAGRSELRYDVALQASGVRFASLLEELERNRRLEREAEGAAPAGDPGVPAVVADGAGGGAESVPPDASRGLLAAEVSLAGVVGRDATRRGRGSIQVGDGPVVSLPLLMPIIEMTNLRLPASTPLDVAFGEFYVLGDTVTFEELSAFTRTVEIWGYGELDWASQRLDMRFNTRSTAPIPVVSELIEGVRNELFSTRVRGTLDEPDVQGVQFQGARRVIDTLLGDGPDEQERRLAEIGERARLNRSRALRAGERLRWLVASQMEGEAGPRE
ncbi:MAG: hypothetical protein R3B68_15550 [Phycisphaerales bacterium]